MISIITAARIDSVEKGAWLIEAIESVQAQTLGEWEMIIVDDLSPQFPELPDDERIRYFRTTENKGPALARNTGVALAEYDAILPLDADDRLADNTTLARMYDAWAQNKKRVVYGDLQRLEQLEGEWRITKVVNLPQYTFELSLNLSGIMPVTCLHSKAAHRASGGWKRRIEFGLEDVEYWIGCGKAGYCGYHLGGQPTLAWRRHQTSRSYTLRHVNQQERAMRDVIRELHEDVFDGRYPMGCCGGGSKGKPDIGQVNATPRASTLDGVRDDEKVWIQYNGERHASFGVKGNFTGTIYRINGPGHKLQVHVQDLRLFKRSGRGRDFAIGIAAPVSDNGDKEKLPEPTVTELEFQGPEPEVTRIERLDKKAADRG